MPPRQLRRQYSQAQPSGDGDGASGGGGSQGGLARQPSRVLNVPGGGGGGGSGGDLSSSNASAASPGGGGLGGFVGGVGGPLASSGSTSGALNMGSLPSSSGGAGSSTNAFLYRDSARRMPTDEELGGSVDVVLKAQNPHAPHNIVAFNAFSREFKSLGSIDHTQIHFQMDSKGFKAGSEEDARQKLNQTAKISRDSGDNTEGEKRNRFDHLQRHTQTFNFPMRNRETNTDPPIRKDAGGFVTQYFIFEAYRADLERQRLEKERHKKKGPSHDDEVMVSKATVAESDALSGYAFRRALKILERMVNLNIYSEVASDYKYLEFAIDDDPGQAGKGSYMPLWDFSFTVPSMPELKRHVTCVVWNPLYKDLFAAGYGSYAYGSERGGAVAVFSLKNPSFPEYYFATDSGVLCLDFHPGQPFLLAVGLYDGSVLVYDIRARELSTPIYRSTIRNGKHMDAVWQVAWQDDDISDKHNFFSVSSDGRITSWTMVNSELRYTDIIRLHLTESAGSGTHSDSGVLVAAAGGAAGVSTSTALTSAGAAGGGGGGGVGVGVGVGGGSAGGEDGSLFGFASGLCFDFNRFSKHLFVVGTEEGKIHKCSKASNTQYLETYVGHQMAVYRVAWNPFHPDCFLSCSADWSVKLWNHNISAPVMSFDLSNSVGDVTWSPYSSTVFGACTSEGRIFVYDLYVNKHEPLCMQKVDKAELTRIAFNPDPSNYTLLAGTAKGVVKSFRLSPNLRRPYVVEEEDESNRMPDFDFAATANKADVSTEDAKDDGKEDRAAVVDDGKPVKKVALTHEQLEKEKLHAILVAQERSVISGM